MPMKNSDLRQALDEIHGMLAELARRVTALESPAAKPDMPAPSVAVVPAAPAAVAEVGLTEEVVIAITAAVAAFLGERAHVRQIRLISSSAWAQQGRVSVQASHRLAR
jgi:methylmalonyl-CoA carboxyltransferase large subunit